MTALMDIPQETAPIGAPVEIRHSTDATVLQAELMRGGQPVVLKGLAGNWPAVTAALQSDEQVVAYLKRLDTGKRVPVSVVAPDQNGRFFFTPDMKGFNYGDDGQFIPVVLDWLLANRDVADVPTIYAQSLPLPVLMPDFPRQNALEAVPHRAPPRLWIGNRVKTQTHFDPSHNLAVCVAGRRRFTLFPPEQICNLYPGPLDRTPGNVPLSMVDIDAPDFGKYPGFREAQAHAQYAELEPGDGLYIPYAWWHHVRSLAPFNLLVNYWWSGAETPRPPMMSPLFLAMVTWRDLPQDEKALWKRMMDLYVFGDHERMTAHLPDAGKGIAGPVTSEVAQRLKAFLKTHFGS